MRILNFKINGYKFLTLINLKKFKNLFYFIITFKNETK